MSSPELVSRAWVALLALTVALLAIAALRGMCRRWLGAERAFQLWWLAPLALVASLLPHATGGEVATLPTLVLVVTQATARGASSHSNPGLSWQDAIAAVWAMGVLAGVVAATLAQRRYRRLLGQAVLMQCVDQRWMVWRAARDDVGPAMVGAWNPRIVVPADFEDRYNQQEQALILAHEAAHASRCDGLWALCARAMLIVCWIHPLAWWAHRAFRLDQELACDAAVMKRHRGQRKNYAQAMLKTQAAAFALPVGCSWSPRHPITERVAMLKQLPPGKGRRMAGRIAMVLTGAIVAGGLYAASNTTAVAHGEHTLKIALALDGQPARLHATACLKGGDQYKALESGSNLIAPWQVSLGVVPAPGGMLEVQADISGGTLKGPVHPFVRVEAGKTVGIQVGEKVMGKNGKEADHTLKMDLTPSNGC